MTGINRALQTAVLILLLGAGGAAALQNSAESNIGSFDSQDYVLTVESAFGGCTPPPGVYSNALGASLVCSRTNDVVSEVTTQRVALGWVGDGSVPLSGTGNVVAFSITTNSLLTWTWKTQYRFDATNGIVGTVLATNGWYDTGTVVSATATVPLGFLFNAWQGDAPEGTASSNPIVLIMDQARAIAAYYALDTNIIRATQNCAGYRSPGTNTLVTCVFAYPTNQMLVSLVWSPELPPGWALIAATGDGAPHVAGTNVLFGGSIGVNPVAFTYSVRVPGDEPVTNQVRSWADFRLSAMSTSMTATATPDALLVARFHSADYKPTLWTLDGTEINRVLAYWRTGGYRLEPLGNDGYAPAATPDLGATGGWHSADFQADRWVIDGMEAARALAYWRGGGYYVNPAGDDGYAAGPSEIPEHGLYSEFVDPQVSQTGPACYDPGQTLTVSNTFAYVPGLLSLYWRPSVPAGWKVVSASGDGNPELQRGDILWTGVLPPSPIHMVYTVRAAVNSLGAKTIGGQVVSYFQGKANGINSSPVPTVLSLSPRDTDGDGMPDGWELWYGGNATGMMPQADDDHDGMNNLHECIAGTNPRDAKSVLRIGPLSLQPDGNACLWWDSATGRFYRIDRATNLVVPFSPLTGGVAATPPTNMYFGPAGNDASIFYRIGVEQ